MRKRPTYALPVLMTCLCITALFSTSHAQIFTQNWQYEWGGGREEFSANMIPLPGNRYFFAGTSASDPGSCNKTSPAYGAKDFAAFVLDDAGNKIWEQSYGGDREDGLYGSAKVASGGYILAGYSESQPSGTRTAPLIGTGDIWVVRIDDNGNQLWDKSFGSAGFQAGRKVLTTADGGFLVAGESGDPANNGNWDYQVLKLDANGNLLWKRFYGGSGFEQFIDIIVTKEGNYLLSGISNSPVSGNKSAPALGSQDTWIVCIDANGTKLWDKSYGSPDMEYKASLLALMDGNNLIVESNTNGGTIRKIDANGNQLWQRNCGIGTQDFFEVATQDIHGNIYVGGESSTNSSGCKTSPFVGGGSFGDIWIAVFDSTGVKIDDMDWGGADSDIITGINIVNDELWIYGWTNSYADGNKTTARCGQSADNWIIRLTKKFYLHSPTPVNVCNNTVNYKTHFTTKGNFSPGNIYTVQLSDATGNFSTYTNIGTKASIESDSIIVTLPGNLIVGAPYKIRVVASLPADTTPPYPLMITPPPSVSLGKDTTICQNTTLLLNAGTQPAGTQIVWSNGSTQSAITVNAAGIYWCEVQNGCGIKRDSITVDIKQIPIADIGNDTGFCKGASVLLQSSPQPVDIIYTWSTGSPFRALMVQQPGNYWLQTANICGSTKDFVTVTEYALPVIPLDKNDYLCTGAGRILNAGAGHSSYEWSDGSTQQTLPVNTIGKYQVSVTDAHGCTNKDSVTITQIRPLPAGFLPGDTSICSYSQLPLRTHTAFSQYAWSTGETTSSIIVTEPALYWVQVTDNYGCVGRDTIDISPKDCPTGFYMPNAFSPNTSPGKNDICRPTLYGNVIKYRFTIYNRWGQRVFETTDRYKGWDGRINSLTVDSETYAWVCVFQFNGEKEQVQKGTVVLIR